jgi:hypothetical protein
MSNPSTKILFGPAALSATLTTNLGPGPAYGGGSALLFDIVKHIHVANKTGSAATFSIWLGATGGNVAGTELFNGLSVPANSVYDFYCNLKVTSTLFLVGGAGTATALTITIEGETYAV